MARRLAAGLTAVLLALLVLLAHWALMGAVARVHAEWEHEQLPPPRLKVAFVRELKAQAPPPASPHLAYLHGATPATPIAIARLDTLAPVAASAAALAPLTAASVPALAALPASAANPGEPGPEWPLSTRLDYRLSGYYRGEVTGSARVEWLRQGAHYQVHLDLFIGPQAAPLVARSMASDGQFGPDGIEPRRYDEETRMIFSEPRRLTLRFVDGGVQLADGHRELVAKGAQDAASQFVHLTWLFLTGRKQMRVGETVDLPLALPRRVYAWRYTVLGEETLYTRIGALQAWHLAPQRDDPALQRTQDLSAEVWLAPQLQYLPVRILIHQNASTFIDLLLAAMPLQAAPQSTDTTNRSPP